MDPTLQKRLIGAFILIVAAIAFVPMLLDGPGQAGTESVDLGIPEPGPDGMRTEVIPLDAPPPVAPVLDEGEINNALGESGASAMASAPPDIAIEPTLPAADPIEPATATEVPAIAVATEHAADTSGRWHVTLGSYANADNARKLVADMLRDGLPARAQAVTLAGKPALRVRIGPYADRVRAEAARFAVAAKRRDVTPALVQDDSAEVAAESPTRDPAANALTAPLATPPVARSEEAAVPAPTSAAPLLRDARGWVVQIGAFAQVSDANAQVDKLRAAGYTAFVDRLDAPRGTLHRVRIGPEAERAGADQLRVSVKQSIGVDGVVMRHP